MLLTQKTIKIYIQTYQFLKPHVITTPNLITTQTDPNPSHHWRQAKEISLRLQERDRREQEALDAPGQVHEETGNEVQDSEVWEVQDWVLQGWLAWGVGWRQEGGYCEKCGFEWSGEMLGNRSGVFWKARKSAQVQVPQGVGEVGGQFQVKIRLI